MFKTSSNFIQNIIKLSSGNMLAQIIGILIVPAITRLFSPEDFGLFALFTSITAIIGAVSCLKFEQAIILPKADEEATNILAVCVVLCFTISGITAGAFYLCGNIILVIKNSQPLTNYAWTFPVMVLTLGLSQALISWNVRVKQFGRISGARIIESATRHLSRLGLGIVGFPNLIVLILTQITGLGISCLLLAVSLIKEQRQLFIKTVSFKTIKMAILRYKDFPLFSSWSDLLGIVNFHLPILAFGYFFSAKSLGFLLLSRMILTLPLSSIGQAIAHVFFQKGVEAKRMGQLPEITSKVYLLLFSCGIFPLFILFFWGKEVYGIFLGDQWSESGRYAEIIGISIFCLFIHSPIGTLFSILERQRVQLIYNIVDISCKGAALIIGGLLNDPILSLILYTLSSLTTIAGIDCWLFIKANVSIIILSKQMAKIFLFCFFCLSPAVLISMFSCISMGFILLTALMGGSFYYVYLFKKWKNLLNLF